MKRLRTFFDTLISPWLAPQCSYEMEYRSGVMPHFMASRDCLALHLLADIPPGRTARALSPMRARQSPPGAIREGWLDVTVPRVLVHEAVKVDLA